MKLKFLIAIVAFLFTVNLASAQVSIQYGTSVPNTSPSVPFNLTFSGESNTAYVVSVQVESSYPYAPQFYGVVTGISGSLNSVNGTSFVSSSSFDGILNVNYSGSGFAVFYVTLGLYDATSDRMWYETHYTGAACY